MGCWVAFNSYLSELRVLPPPPHTQSGLSHCFGLRYCDHFLVSRHDCFLPSTVKRRRLSWGEKTEIHNTSTEMFFVECRACKMWKMQLFLNSGVTTRNSVSCSPPNVPWCHPTSVATLAGTHTLQCEKVGHSLFSLCVPDCCQLWCEHWAFQSYTYCISWYVFGQLSPSGL